MLATIHTSLRSFNHTQVYLRFTIFASYYDLVLVQ